MYTDEAAIDELCKNIFDADRSTILRWKKVANIVKNVDPDKVWTSSENHETVLEWREKAKKWDERERNGITLTPSRYHELIEKANHWNDLVSYYESIGLPNGLTSKDLREIYDKAKKWDNVSTPGGSELIISRRLFDEYREKAKKADQLDNIKRILDST